jgi:O-antigen ligase
MVFNMLKDKGQVKGLLIAMFITCAIVCVTTYPQIFRGERTTTPFEGAEGEPATLGGYLLLMMAVISGFLLYSNSRRASFYLILLLVLIIPPFLFSLSRASYMGFIPMLLALAFLTKRKRGFLIVGIILLATLFISGVMPKSVKERITTTFTGEEYKVGPVKMVLESSAGARIESWQNVVKKVAKNPLWGYGVTGIGFLDSQYFLVLGELGLIGMFVFLWLISAIFTNGLNLFRISKDGLGRGMGLGFVAGFAGLLTHAFTSNTFIIVRIMEPFWFLTAIVMFLLESERTKG